MDTPPLNPPANLPEEENSEEPKKSLGNLRNQLETGQGMTPPTGEDAINQNKNQPLANPKIQTPNIGNVKPE